MLCFASRNPSYPIPSTIRRCLTSLAVESSNTTVIEKEDYGSSDDDHDEDDDSRHQPWKSLLTTSGRCRWRVSHVPEHIKAIVSDLHSQGGRTRKTLKQVHETIVAKHLEFAKAREKERNRFKSGGTELSKKREIQVIPYGPNETLAHLYFRFTPQYLVIHRILQEAASLIDGGRLERFLPRRVLDVGIGTGAASVAALEVFDTIEWVHGVDPSTPMKQITERVLSHPQHPRPPPRCTVSSHLSITSETSDFDIGLMCYTASEFTHNAATIAAAAAVWGKLAVGGIFVMVEPGTPDGFRSIRTVRSMLLDCANDEDTMCDIIAPCTHNGPCPMETIQIRNKVFRKTKQRNDNKDEDASEAMRSGFCSFVHTMPDGAKTEKFSYLVARKRPVSDRDNQHEFHNDSVVTLLRESLQHQEGPDDSTREQVLDLRERYLDADEDPIGLELVRSARHEFGRIVHAPMKRKGHVLIDACVAPGELVRFTVSKRSTDQAPGLYAASKKSRWGGLWPHIPDLQDK